MSRRTALDLLTLLNGIPQQSLLVIGAYVVLAGLYLLVVPLALFFWMNKRWHHMGNIERLLVYGCVFLFFPGMVVFAPFLNLRMSGQGDV